MVDYVIIGGGMTGASLAYQMSRPGSAGAGKKIVMLEAKDIASGASESPASNAPKTYASPYTSMVLAGRNGGHVAPTNSEYLNLLSPISSGGAGVDPAEAVTIIDSEVENFHLMQEICSREGLADRVDFNVVEAMEGILFASGYSMTFSHFGWS